MVLLRSACDRIDGRGVGPVINLSSKTTLPWLAIPLDSWCAPKKARITSEEESAPIIADRSGG
jgi:hypothetical protein